MKGRVFSEEIRLDWRIVGVDLGEIGWEDVGWTHLAQDRD
jgi:hypothetical protein